MGESPAYDDFSITHGLCARCESKHDDLFEGRDLDRSVLLGDIFQNLFAAGRRSDFAKAGEIVEQAMSENCRPVDILMGMIAPMLYEIGEEWKRGGLSVAGEHSFTAFCERVLDLVTKKISRDARSAQLNNAGVVLANAPGNSHSLAIRILALWLQSRGVRTVIVGEQADSKRFLDELMRQLAANRPNFLLISMALAEQREGVTKVIARVKKLPKSARPKVIVGGYAVKSGMVSPILGADLVADITGLSLR
jgi:methanogenic corrinoid protein MtbC1